MGDLTKNFSRWEFACRCGCGFNTVDFELLINLQVLRDEINSPINIISGCRCPKHNLNVGGATNSQHMKAKAADITTSLPPQEIYNILNKKFMRRFGLRLWISGLSM
jgi:hypothetical protein